MDSSYSESDGTLAESAADAARSEPTGFAFGPFVIDLQGQRLSRDGEPMALSPRVFQTLVVLVRNRDRVVTKDELIATLWPGTFVSDDSLVQNISILRRTLGDDPGTPKYIATAAKRGYRFIDTVVEHAPGRPAEPRVAKTAAAAPPMPAPVHPVRSQMRMHLAYAATALVALVVGAILFNMIAVDARSTNANRQLFAIEAPLGTAVVSGGALSPDGRFLAFVAQDLKGTPAQRIWIREMESGATRQLQGTEGVANLFWSPAGTDIGFFADNRVKRIGLADDLVRVLTETTNARPLGGTWSIDGQIMFSDTGSLFVVSAAGGDARLLRTPRTAANEYSLAWPQFLPDGQHYLYRAAGAERTGTYLSALGSDFGTFVVPASGSAVAYAAPGRLVFIRDKVVMGQQFDPTSGALKGDSVPITTMTVAGSSVSASADGLLAFGGGAAIDTAWLDRGGSVIARVEPPRLVNMSLSPDGKALLGSKPDGIWHVDLERKTRTRLVANGSMPLWSTAGDKFVYASHRGEQNDLYIHSMRGGAVDRQLLRTSELTFAMDWSPDDQYILYVSWNRRTHHDLWVLPASGSGKPQPYLVTTANETQGAISPDGHWLAYASDESGRWEVYVDRFPERGLKLAISSGGGAQPHWRADGKELYYLCADGTMIAVDMQLGSMPVVGTSRSLFRTVLPGGLVDQRNVYTVSADGQRFLVSMLNVDDTPEPIRLLTNWSVTPKTPVTSSKY